MNIKYQQITYQDARAGLQVENDVYSYANGDLYSCRKNAFLNNPFLKDESTCMLLLARVDDIVVGKRLFYSTKIKVGEEIIDATSGSNYVVHQDYRKYGLGGAMIMHAAKKKNNFLLSAGCSENSLEIYKALNAVRVYIPMYRQCKCKVLNINSTSFRTFCSSSLTSLFNFLLIPFMLVSKIKSKSVTDKFTVLELTAVPQWIEDMVLADEHKYMEFHNKDWFEWNLKYNFSGDNDDRQSLFAVKKEGVEVGFYFIKERKLGSRIVGSLVEWQTSDEGKLSEEEIIMLALSSFSKRVCDIQIPTFSESFKRNRFLLGFRATRPANIVFKDLCKKYPDSSDVNLWRLRMGYADVIMSK